MVSQDIQELRKSLQFADTFLNQHLNVQAKADEVLHAIVSKSLDMINNEVPSTNILFDYSEIYAAVWGTTADTDKASKRVRNYISEIMEKKLESSSPLNQALIDENLQPLRLNVETSTGGKRTLFHLVTSESNEPAERRNESNNITYIATQLPKPYWWVKPFTDFVISPSKIVVTVFSGIALLWSGLFVITGHFLSSAPMYLSGGLALLIGFGCYFMYRFNELASKGLTTIPTFMIPIKQSNSLFVLTRERDSPDELLKVEAVVYQADCPICGDRIIIEKSKEFHGRYLGKCAVAPSEHVYSFDHVTKKGRFLR